MTVSLSLSGEENLELICFHVFAALAKFSFRMDIESIWRHCEFMQINVDKTCIAALQICNQSFQPNLMWVARPARRIARIQRGWRESKNYEYAIKTTKRILSLPVSPGLSVSLLFSKLLLFGRFMSVNAFFIFFFFSLRSIFWYDSSHHVSYKMSLGW